MPIKTPPANADTRLVRAFQEAARGDGRINKQDVEGAIQPLIKDGNGLSAREKSTIKWAVEEFKMTGQGKRALSDVITEAAGAPVFEWQRELKGPVSVQLGSGLPRAQLDKKAAEAFAANCVSIGDGSFDADLKYDHPYAGNGGTHVYGVEGKKAETILKFLAATQNDPDILNKYSTRTHAVYTVYESGDESHFGGIVVDKATGKATAFDTYNIVDIPSDREQYEAIFGPMLDNKGKRVTDEVFEERQYDLDIHEELMGGRDIPLPNFSAAQERRRQGPLNDARRVLAEAYEKHPSDQKVSFDYSTLARTTNLDKQLADLVSNAQSSDWRDSEKRGATHKVLQDFRPWDDAARTAVVDTLKAGSGRIRDAQVEKFLEGFGNSADFQYASAELPMTIRDGNNREKTIKVVAHFVVNTREGDYLTLYQRARTASDN